MTTVTILIPSIPGRSNMLSRAVASVAAQSHPCQMGVRIDHHRAGASATRNRLIWSVLSDPDYRPAWVGFLDDDDYLHVDHVAHLLSVADEHDADVVWPWFRVEGGTDPFPDHRGRQYDPEHPHIFPITYLARTRAVLEAMTDGGFRDDPAGTGAWEVQDQPFIDALWRVTDGRFHASDRVTWTWCHHRTNTSGVATR